MLKHDISTYTYLYDKNSRYVSSKYSSRENYNSHIYNFKDIKIIQKLFRYYTLIINLKSYFVRLLCLETKEKH